MATHNPAGLYTGGAVIFNSQPAVNAYHQFIQKKMARDEALDDYFRSYGKNINPAGMRQQDIDGLMQKQKEWNQFYQQNKDRIKNPRIDNGKALTEYQSRYQDQLAYIDKSKERVEVRKQMGQARLNPSLSHIFDDDKVIQQIHDDDLPLNDPNHKPIDIYQLSIQPKPFDMKARESYQKGVTAGLKPSKNVKGIATDPKTLQDIVTYENGYSPEDLHTIGERAKSYYQSDPSIRNYANKNLINPQTTEQLNEIYKQVYGKNAETPQDLFAAESIANSRSTGVEQKATAGSLAKSLYLEGVKQNNRTAIAKLRHNYKQADKRQQAQMENGVYDEMKADALKNPAKYKDASGKESTNYIMSTTPDVQAILAIKDEKGHDTQIDQVVFTPDGYVKGIVYKRDENGELLPKGPNGYPVDSKLTTKMLESEFKARWIKGIFGAKEAKQATSEGGSSAPKAVSVPAPKTGSYNLNGKTYTHKQLNDMGYDDNEIEQAKKAGLLK